MSDHYRDTRRIPPPATTPPPTPPPPTGRPPTPADLRCRLDPATVDALATYLHPDPATDPDVGRAHARFLLLGLRDTGWTLHHTGPTTGPLDPAAVDALAAQIHTLHCIPVFGRDPHTGDRTHAALDTALTRSVLLGLHDSGWTLHRT